MTWLDLNRIQYMMVHTPRAETWLDRLLNPNLAFSSGSIPAMSSLWLPNGEHFDVTFWHNLFCDDSKTTNVNRYLNVHERFANVLVSRTDDSERIGRQFTDKISFRPRHELIELMHPWMLDQIADESNPCRVSRLVDGSDHDTLFRSLEITITFLSHRAHSEKCLWCSHRGTGQLRLSVLSPTFEIMCSFDFDLFSLRTYDQDGMSNHRDVRRWSAAIPLASISVLSFW
jgi:hypothetical protein